MSEELERGIREEVKAGSVRTYRVLYTHYKPMVSHLLRGNGQSAMDTDDFFRKTTAYLYLLEKQGSLPVDVSIKTLVYSIARHLLSQTVSDIKDFEEYVDLSVDGEPDEELVKSFKEIESDISSADLSIYRPSKKPGKTWTVMSWVMIIGSLGLGVVFVVMMTKLPRIEELRERAGLTKQLNTDTVMCESISVPAAPKELVSQLVDLSGIHPDSIEAVKALSPSFPLQICEDSNDNFDFHYRNSPKADSLILYGVDAESADVFHLLSIPKPITDTLGYTERGNLLFLRVQDRWYLLDRKTTKAEPLKQIQE